MSDNLITDVRKLQIDIQRLLKANKPIQAGSGCKVYYDANGIVTRSSELAPIDIPKLPISKITGLNDILKDVLTIDDVKRIIIDSSEINPISNSKTTTTCKGVYKDGILVDSEPLSESDIPQLSMDKISGLNDTIATLSLSSNEDVSLIEPATKCKITYDSYGNITHGDDLTMSDMPSEIQNYISEDMSGYVTRTEYNNLSTQVDLKVHANTFISPGVYTKVTVDHKGLVIAGAKSSAEDMEDIQISNIYDLERQLSNKVDTYVVESLQDSVNQVLSQSVPRSEITAMQQDLSEKVSRDEIDLADKSLKELLVKINNLDFTNDISNIMSTISSIQASISSLESRMSSIEFFMNNLEN